MSAAKYAIYRKDGFAGKHRNKATLLGPLTLEQVRHIKNEEDTDEADIDDDVILLLTPCDLEGNKVEWETEEAGYWPPKEQLNEKAQAAATKLGLTLEEVKYIHQEAHSLYCQIAGDLPADNRRKRTCKRSTIIEVILDAGRLNEAILNDPNRRTARKNEIVKRLRNANHQTKVDLISPAFPAEEYEVGF